jgi:exodeoxyribonuclease VII small subunit
MAEPELTYRGALEELREIHARLRRDDVDIDALLTDVQRASDLLAFCRERLTAVGGRLEEVLEGFDAPEEPS